MSRHTLRSIHAVLFGCLAALLAASGCSAIVSPDPSRLGGTDAPGVDAGTLDAPGLDAPVDGATPDGGGDAPIECTGDGDCDDGVSCTTNRCRSSRCEYVADDTACADGERCSDTLGCVPIRCETDAECIDADACNGEESCDPESPAADDRTGCVPGVAPVCNDGLGCTVDACDPSRGCVAVPDDTRCNDGVACTVDECTATAGPSGCENRPDDTLCGSGCTVGSTCIAASGCTPGMRRDCDDETDCTVDSCDEGAAGFCVHEPVDADGDGAPAQRTATALCAGGTDCDDTNADVGPGEAEVCNGRDDNCDGTTDEGCITDGDDCGGAAPITLSGTTVRTATINGTFGSFTPDYAACAGLGRDAVYYLDLTANSDVRLDTIGSAVPDTILAVGTTCALANFAAACNDDQDPGPGGTLTSRIWLHNVGPTTPGGSLRVFILVKAYGADPTGAFRLNVQVTTPRGDSCGDGTSPLDISGGGLVLGNIGALSGASSARGSCDPATFSGSEAVFRFLGPADNQAWAIEARSAAFRPVLFTRGVGTSSCASGASETSCDLGDGGVARVTNVAAESGRSSYVFVDGAGVGGGAYSLSFDP